MNVKSKGQRIDEMQQEAAKAQAGSAKREAWMLAAWELEATMTPEERMEWGTR